MDNSSNGDYKEPSGEDMALLNPVQRQLMEYRMKHRRKSEAILSE